MAERYYASGTRAALIALSRGTCYRPSCPEPVVLIEDGVPVLRLDIAHICALEPGGPRHDPLLERPNDFGNLLMLCNPHHKLIDQIAPDRYPIDLLLAWKRARETGPLEELVALRNLTENRLQEMISESFEAVTTKLNQALAKLASIDIQAAALLTDFRDELIRAIPTAVIDPDAAAMLDRAAFSLRTLQDTAPVIARAAERLGGLQDTAGQLQNAADDLASVKDAASTLLTAARALRSLPDATTRLANVVDEYKRYGPHF